MQNIQYIMKVIAVSFISLMTGACDPYQEEPSAPQQKTIQSEPVQQKPVQQTSQQQLLKQRKPPVATNGCDQVNPDQGLAVKQLLGGTPRVYTLGDPLTEDFRPDRVNIELDEQGKIRRIWKG